VWLVKSVENRPDDVRPGHGSHGQRLGGGADGAVLGAVSLAGPPEMKGIDMVESLKSAE
jgi:hypothetical protein